MQQALIACTPSEASSGVRVPYRVEVRTDVTDFEDVVTSNEGECVPFVQANDTGR